MKAYVVVNNTDLTEGRGRLYPQHVCDLYSTAKRLAHKAGIQGCDAHVEECEILPRYANGFDYGPVWRNVGTKEDCAAETIRIEQMEKFARKQEILDKAKSLGLTDDEIALLK